MTQPTLAAALPQTEPEVLRQPNVLYRFFDAAGMLLYIGITIDPAIRWRAHSKTKPDWRLVASITLEHFDSRQEAESAEILAIQKEQPAWNIQHKLGVNRPQARRQRPSQFVALPVSAADIERAARSGDWLPLGQVATVLRVSRNKVHLMLRSGEIGYRLIPGNAQRLQRECNPQDVVRLLDESRVVYRGDEPVGSLASDR
jgi:predicted GIY-YIG superfamily endonuclease